MGSRMAFFAAHLHAWTQINHMDKMPRSNTAQGMPINR
jgi:hypothetical protein